MSKTRWIIFAAICALVLGGLVAISGRNKANVADIDPSQIITAQNDVVGDNVYGKKDAKVVVFEYGDFQCPSCGGAFPNVAALKDKYKDQIAFVFRNLPLTSIHPNALSAATAAEAAGQQGKFWEMHDALYQNQSEWSGASTTERNSIFEKYAASAGVNIDTYRQDLLGKVVTEKIARDRALAKKVNANATPTLYIGSTKVNDEAVGDLVQGKGEKLAALIDQELKKAGVTTPQ